MAEAEMVCWELLDPAAPALEQARQLYESTQAADERIPWDWIRQAVVGRPRWRPGQWAAHLLVAAPRLQQRAAGRVAGFAYGIHVPGYGGYASYLGVEPRARGRGTGTRLLRLLLRVLQVDACGAGEPLPFLVWESRRPDPEAPAQEWDLWRSRLRLFEKVGGWWVAGLTLWAPNFARRQGPAVPLQLFLVPVDTPRAAFGAAALREVAAGLLREVYGRAEDDPLFAQTLPPDCRPEMRPVADAATPR
jgi:ribosomal protein S18 acetylase RimI-like enzyme